MFYTDELKVCQKELKKKQSNKEATIKQILGHVLS